MIGKNLGRLERTLRVLAALLLASWALSRPEFGGTGWLAMTVSLFLVLNGVFGRCYLWHLLHISSCGCNSIPPERLCNNGPA